MADTKAKLPAEVAEKYKLVNWIGSPRKAFGTKYGIVSINDMTLDRAKTLVAKKFPYLAEKSNASPVVKSTSK